MKRYFRKMILPVLLLLAILTAGCGIFGVSDKSGAENLGKIRVMLEKTEGLVISSDTYVDVEPGGSAVFDVEIKSGYYLSGLSDGVYDEASGRIVLAGVKYPRSITLSLRKSADDPATTPEDPTPGPTPEPTPDPTPSAILLKDPSRNETLESFGGSSVRDPDPGTFRIVYHANGGKIADVKSDTAAQLFPLDFYLCPNTLPDAGYFTREGFVLAGYTENTDGSGKYYGPGWNIVPEKKGGVLENQKELYCLWIPVTPVSDFTFNIAADCVMITGYSGDDSVVVIPETVAGYKVIMIDSGAFAGKNMTELHIPKYVEVIASKAFEGCSSLERVFLSDSVISMQDNAFDSCEKLKTLNVKAVRNPVYSSTLICSSSTIKYERLMTTDGKKLIHVSGSNGLYAIDSKKLETAVGRGYTVVNMSVNANCNAPFALEVITKVAKEGDVVVMSPENNGNQLGVTRFNPTMWQSLEGIYDALAAVDIRNFNTVYSSFASYNLTRSGMAEDTYKSRNEELNDRGDIKRYIEETKGNYVTKQEMYLAEGGKYTYTEGLSLLRVYGASLTKQIKILKELGCETLMSFAATDRCCLVVDSGGYEAGKYSLSTVGGAEPLTESAKDAKVYEEFIDRNFIGTRISCIADSILEPDCFFNSEWHVNGKGRDIRTEKLAEDINKYFEGLEAGLSAEQAPSGQLLLTEDGGTV